MGGLGVKYVNRTDVATNALLVAICRNSRGDASGGGDEKHGVKKCAAKNIEEKYSRQCHIEAASSKSHAKIIFAYGMSGEHLCDRNVCNVCVKYESM